MERHSRIGVIGTGLISRDIVREMGRRTADRSSNKPRRRTADPSWSCRFDLCGTGVDIAECPDLPPLCPASDLLIKRPDMCVHVPIFADAELPANVAPAIRRSVKNQALAEQRLA